MSGARLLKPDEVSQLLGVREDTLVQLGFPCVRIGKSRRYRLEDLQVVLSESRVVDLAFRQTNPHRGRHLYFIRNVESGKIKIGIAADVEKRKRDLENGSGYGMEVVGSIYNGSDLECLLHVAFRHSRGIGEWFEATPELLTLARKASRDAVMAFVKVREAEGDFFLLETKGILMAYPWKDR